MGACSPQFLGLDPVGAQVVEESSRVLLKAGCSRRLEERGTFIEQKAGLRQSRLEVALVGQSDGMPTESREALADGLTELDDFEARVSFG